MIRTPAGNVSLAAVAAVRVGHCASCHGTRGSLAHLSPGHISAASQYHRDPEILSESSPSEGCLNCHSSGSRSSWRQATPGKTIRFDTHASHPFGIVVYPGTGTTTRRIRTNIDSRLPLFDGKIECQTCHMLTAGTKNLLVPFDEPYDLCLGCHRMRGRGIDRRESVGAVAAAYHP